MCHLSGFVTKNKVYLEKGAKFAVQSKNVDLTSAADILYKIVSVPDGDLCH